MTPSRDLILTPPTIPTTVVVAAAVIDMVAASEQLMTDAPVITDQGTFDIVRSVMVNAQSVLRTIDSLHEGYQWSRDKFVGLQQQAVRHAANLDYWLEALDLQLFYLDFLRAAVRGELPGKRKPMLARLDALKTRTADLFAATYTRDSLEAELTARYGFIEGYLTGMAGVGE